MWEMKHEECFQKLKTIISDVKTLRFFDTNLRTRVVADASPVALGGVLIQFENTTDENPRIIGYASKSLSATEKRYCQTEKEALAIVWAVERFSTYLIGRKFELETDHKPLEVIFSANSRPCARIERWVLRLQSYTFNVKYRKGSQNIADPLSRLTLIQPTCDFDDGNKYLVLAILESVAVDISEVEFQTVNDLEMQKVVECVKFGNWDDPAMAPYQQFKTELGLAGDLLVRGSKLVIPKGLQGRLMDLAHEGHPGETVMKKRLRDRVWWPGMDKQISQYVIKCEGCRLVSLPNKPEPMSRRKLPNGPWIDVAIDFMGPLPSGEYLLVIVDYYSRYKEVEIMNQITAKDTISRLQQIFVRLGYPRTITLDNGRQFASMEFEQFCKTKGIHLNSTIPYWPQQNGEVERQNRSLLKRLQISHSLNRDWKKDLLDYLMMYYTTPHSTTGRTPTELCFGRTIRSKIPCIKDIETTPNDEELSDRDYLSKLKGKEREDNRRKAQPIEMETGDTVLMKNMFKKNKLTPTFNPSECVVMDRTGSKVTVQDKSSGKIYDRNAAHLKKITDSHQEDQPDNSAPCSTPMLGNTDTEPRTQHTPVLTEVVGSSPKVTTDSSHRNRRAVKRPLRYDDYLMDDESLASPKQTRCGTLDKRAMALVGDDSE